MENKAGIEVKMSPRELLKGVNMDSFRNLNNENRYLEESINHDKRKVEERKNQFFNKNKGGDGLELVFVQQAEKSKWFGDENLITKTSEFDDVFNGADFYLEFKGQEDKPRGERIIFSIDTTSSVENQKLMDKFDSAVNKVASLDGGSIKYFESKADGFKGYLQGTIPLVIGINNNYVIDLQCARNDLQNHPYQMIFLEEVKLQLECYLTLTISEKMRTKIGMAKEKIDQILRSKRNLSGMTKNDVTAEKLNYYVETKIKQRKSISQMNQEGPKLTGKKIILPYEIKTNKKTPI